MSVVVSKHYIPLSLFHSVAKAFEREAKKKKIRVSGYFANDLTLALLPLWSKIMEGKYNIKATWKVGDEILFVCPKLDKTSRKTPYYEEGVVYQGIITGGLSEDGLLEAMRSDMNGRVAKIIISENNIIEKIKGKESAK